MINTTPDKVRQVERNRLQFLDGLRGLAALYVMIGHARWLLWEGYTEGYVKHPRQYGLLNKAAMYFFSLFKFGHEAVLFFFVLSGFVIHLKYAKNLSQLAPVKFNWPDYLYRRAKRIYPPFVVALLLTFLLDAVGRSLKWSIYSGTTPYQLINENIGQSNWNIKTLLGNIFFLYKQYVPVFGTNGPAWSLKYEWWFYMLYPLFLVIGTRKIIYPSLLLTLLFVASFFPQYWSEKLLCDVFSMMITWWLGVILAEVYANRIKLSFRYLSFSALILLLMPFLRLSNVVSDLFMAIFFFGLISFFISLRQRNGVIRGLEKLKIIGDFSYTLYITHFPILVFISGWLIQRQGGSLPTHFLFVLIGIVVTVVSAFLLHFVTEVPFTRPKKRPLSVAEKKMQQARELV